MFNFQKIIKNRKKQNFQIFTKNSVTIMEMSKKKHSWVFFEIGIENGFLATKNGFLGTKNEKK